MKKILILFLVLTFLLTLTGCKEEKLTDSLRFKTEYESINNQTYDDNKKYSEIIINEKNPIKYVDYQGLIDGLNNGTHVIYMGWKECLWCRRLLPVLLNTVNEYSGMSIYYYSIKDARDAYLTSGDKDLADIYKKISDELDLSSYDFDGLLDRNDDGSLNIVASLVIFVSQGEVIGAYKRTVESHIDPYEPLTLAQSEELANIYRFYLDAIKNTKVPACDSGC